MNGRGFLMRAWIVGLLIAGMHAGTAGAQTAGLGIQPMRLELEVMPGKTRTASFSIEAPPSDNEVRGRLMLGLTDWSIHEDTSVTYQDPGTQSRSAASWITFTPSDVGISSGQQRLVRVTAAVPQQAEPGLYTAALFVQERPPTRLPQIGEQLFQFRFRYVVTLYVIVPPVFRQAEIADLQLQSDAQGTRLVTRLQNTGTRHLRPMISWFVRARGKEVVAEHNTEATVLLPGTLSNETLTLSDPLPPGGCEIEVQVDFNDGRPVQAVRRMVDTDELAAMSASLTPPLALAQ